MNTLKPKTFQQIASDLVIYSLYNSLENPKKYTDEEIICMLQQVYAQYIGYNLRIRLTKVKK